MGILFNLSSVSVAQEKTDINSVTIGQELLQSNSDILSCHVIWKRVIRSFPVTDIDPTQRKESMLAWAKQNGMSDSKAQKVAEISEKHAKELLKGSVKTSTLDFTRKGNNVLAKISYPDTGDNAIEYFDGVNSVFGWTQDTTDRASSSAILVRNSDEVLSHSARRSEEARFLLGIPLTQQFSDYNPAVKPQDIRLHTALDGGVRMKISDAPYREFTFSKAHNSLASFRVDSSVYSDQSQKTLLPESKDAPDIVAQDFREYGKGVWFPSSVTYNTSYATTEYTLIKAEFNDEVDPAGLRLPAGIRITDRRFGADTEPLVYSPKDGQLPSDAEAKKMLGLKADEDVSKTKAGAQAGKLPVSKAALPLLGLLCIGFGATLWKRASKME